MSEAHEEYGELVRELRQGESLRWTGRPALGLRMVRSDWLTLPGSLFFLAFAIFWNTMVWRNEPHGGGPPLFFKLFGLPFLAWGAFLVFGRPFWEAYRRAHTFYGITDDRVVIVTRVFGRKTQSVLLRTLGQTSLQEHADGRATIWLGPEPSFADLLSVQFGNRRNEAVTPRLEALQDPRMVHEFLVTSRNFTDERRV